MIAKLIARKIIFPVITTINFEKLFLLLSKNKRMVLVYHGVVPKPDFNISAGHLDTEQFEGHLKYFKKNFNVVTSAEIFEFYRKNIIPSRPTLAITFDDGYENNYTQAYPLLKKYNLPATFFISTQSFDNENSTLWYDKLYFINSKINFTDLDFSPANISQETKNTIKNLKSNSEFISFFKHLATADKSELFAIIKSNIDYDKIISDYPRELWKLMNKNQLNEIAGTRGMELGSHTHTHPNLGEIDLSDAGSELKKSKELLEGITGKKVTSIAFPDGDYTEEVKKKCFELGYTDLFAVDYRIGTDVHDKNLLPRFCISCTTTLESNIIQINAGFRKTGF